MWNYPDVFDCIVVGGGHAGCEAAWCAAQMGARVLLLSMNLDTIGKMSCNPAVGGTAKGHLVREIDALGGIMGKVADRTGIQFRMLNRSKGPAVWSPRCQSDKAAYAGEMKRVLEGAVEMRQGTVERFLMEGGRVVGVTTKEGVAYSGRSVIISSGTFMRGLMHMGEREMSGGRAGDKAVGGLSRCLEELGLKLGRLKTGTPPRICGKSIDYGVCEEQPGEEGVRFSHDEDEARLPQVSCWITHTTERTKDLVLANLERSPMYSGKVGSVGPRYCPSIEDKFARFVDKERHQVYLEPEGLGTSEVYVNGISTSLPVEVQEEMVRSVTGLERAVVMRWGYAIEYDYVLCGQVGLTLEVKGVEGLYLAGQVNGTTGYEEAAAQGLVAAVNAVRKVRGEEGVVFGRGDGYIGVLIEDLVTKDHREPYRLFTSRAEHRLLLRQDNADMRLREMGRKIGTVNDAQWERFLRKREAVERGMRGLERRVQVGKRQVSLGQVLCRPEENYQTLRGVYGLEALGDEAERFVEVEMKYAGYIQRQEREVAKMKTLDEVRVPSGFDFGKVVGLRKEAQEKLLRLSPNNLGQASRISGVSPADISILLVALKR